MATIFKPLTQADFNSNVLNFAAKGISGTCTAGQTLNLDLKMDYDSILTGGFLVLNNHAYGDTAKLQIIDKDNILGLGANYVVREFVTDWAMASDTQIQPWVRAGYPAKPFQNLYLRLIYTSTGNSDVGVSVNYELHKVLE